MPRYLDFIIFVLALSGFICCVRYLYISIKAIRHHKRELARMAQVADPETMQKLKWKGYDLDAEAEEDLAQRFREALKASTEKNAEA